MISNGLDEDLHKSSDGLNGLVGLAEMWRIWDPMWRTWISKSAYPFIPYKKEKESAYPIEIGIDDGQIHCFRISYQSKNSNR